MWTGGFHPEGVTLQTRVLGCGGEGVETRDLEGFAEGRKQQSLRSVTELLGKYTKGFSESSLGNQRIAEL